MKEQFITPGGMKPQAEVLDKVKEFLNIFEPYEISSGTQLVLYLDEKSKAYYFICHLAAAKLVESCDLDASLDGSEDDDIYKLNRDIVEDQMAFKRMKEDACEGRSFEDMVIEYDTSYHESKPLKVYGGQHRIKALIDSQERNEVVHGIRVYFNLSRDQKVEIATINNTSIAVPSDLLDRMREQLLGSELRDWCQNVGLLNKGQDFADRKNPEAPTVRVARTLLVNFYLGKDATNIKGFHQPILCKSGGLDETYIETRKRINWSDTKLIEMGKQFAKLHKVQRESVNNRTEDTLAEYARKALSMTVVSSWAYAAGLFQRDADLLKHLYGISDTASNSEDPLNAKALSQARHQGIDPDTYRGLGARNSPGELGRMLEVFLVLATKANKKKITKDLANAAIKSYEAKKATHQADEALGKI
jgi:hypothetical protein